MNLKLQISSTFDANLCGENSICVVWTHNKKNCSLDGNCEWVALRERERERENSMILMYWTEVVSSSDIDAFGCWTVWQRTMIQIMGWITPPFWSFFVKVEKGEEDERTCKGHPCVETCWQNVVVSLPPTPLVLEDKAIENASSDEPGIVCHWCRWWPMICSSK